MRYIQRGVDLANPVDFAHPLNVGLKAWYLALPGLVGGGKWLDLMSSPDLGYGNHGTLTNIVQGVASGWQGASRPGGYGAMCFDAVDDVVLAPNNANLGPANKMSFFCWFYGTGTISIERMLASKWTSSTGWYIEVFNSKLNAQTNAASFAGAKTLVSKTWYHAGFTFDGATLTIYLNGTFDGSGGSALSSAAINLNIGRYSFSNGLLWLGLLDDLRIYNRALGAAEVRDLYLESAAGYPRALQWIGTKRYPLSSLIVPQKYTYVEEEGD